MTNVRLLPVSVEHLVALQSDPSAFGRMIGSPVPDGWPEFPESIDFTIDRLREHPEQADWVSVSPESAKTPKRAPSGAGNLRLLLAEPRRAHDEDDAVGLVRGRLG
jgi:hypothetical protein